MVCGVRVGRSATVVISIKSPESDFFIDKVASVVIFTILLELMISVEDIRVVFFKNDREETFGGLHEIHRHYSLKNIYI